MQNMKIYEILENWKFSKNRNFEIWSYRNVKHCLMILATIKKYE